MNYTLHVMMVMLWAFTNFRGSQDLELLKCVCSSSQGLIKHTSGTCKFVVLVILKHYLYFFKKILQHLDGILNIPICGLFCKIISNI